MNRADKVALTLSILAITIILIIHTIPSKSKSQILVEKMGRISAEYSIPCNPITIDCLTDRDVLLRRFIDCMSEYAVEINIPDEDLTEFFEYSDLMEDSFQVHKREKDLLYEQQ